MPIFCDLPVLNDTFDFYAELRVQLSLAFQYQNRLREAMKGIKKPVQIRFFEKKVRKREKSSGRERVYKYNCHHLRETVEVTDKKGRRKVHHRTRYLKKVDYDDMMKEAALYEYLSLQLDIANRVVDAAQKMLLRGFYHHPDDIPDFDEEARRVAAEVDDVDSHRKWHMSNRVWANYERYSCADENNLHFMSRGELLLHNAFRSCGLLPKYEVQYYDSKSGKRYYPDFSCKIDGKEFYFEYFGMMRDPKYFSDCCDKLRAYAEHGIIPGHNFVAFFSGEASAIRMAPAFEVLKKLRGGRQLLSKESVANYLENPGFIMLDSSQVCRQLPVELLQYINSVAKKHVPKGHRLKSSEKKLLSKNGNRG